MGKQLETESLEKLIGAVEKYIGELETHKTTLQNAANICDQAMGSDVIAQRHIAKLEEALQELNKTSVKADKVLEALKTDLQHAIDVVPDN